MTEQNTTSDNLNHDMVDGQHTNDQTSEAKAEAQTADNTTTATPNTEDTTQATPSNEEAPAPKQPNYALELKELKDKYLRLHAEFDTAKRRMARERIELSQTAGREIIVELLPVLDDFERAFKAAPAAGDIKGFELIYHKLKTILDQKGLKPMNATGEPFNPDLHEAIAQIPAPNDSLRDKIIDEVEKGYYIHDKILRYAKVVVGN